MVIPAGGAALARSESAPLINETLRGELKRILGVREDFPLDPVDRLMCSCWMRTRFEIYEQSWFREEIRKLDHVTTVFELLEAIEDIYEARLRGRRGMSRKSVIWEMVDDLPPTLA